MGKKTSLVGLRFSRLTVIEETERKNAGRRYICKCDCGVVKEVDGTAMTHGGTQSCGCLARERTAQRSIRHGHASPYTRTPTYRSWEAMIRRVTNPRAANWAEYGGRGISVCDHWKSFENFLEDMGERPDGTTIDRINPNGDYEPGNCRWASAAIQSRNTRATKITMEDAEAIRDAVACGFTQKSQCSKYGLSPGTVSEIVSRKMWA